MAPESQSEDHDAQEETHPPEEIVSKLRQVDVLVSLNLDSYGGGFTARTLTFLMFWLISA